MEVDLNGDKNINQTLTKFSYLQCDSTNLFKDLVQVIKSNTKERKKYINICGKDIVVYHSIRPIDALNVELEIGSTSEGNDRIPLSKPLEIEYVVGNAI